jgi:MarR family transcriptional regulator, organic hydroperoxide resistance regulator
MATLRGSNEDIEVSWARRQESIRGILKLIRIMVLAVQNHAAQVEQRGHVTAPQLWLLWELRRAPGLRVVDLARIMAVHANGVRDLLADLMARGLVREISNIERVARLAITEAGRDILETVPGPAQGVVFAALDKLDDGDLGRLAEAMQPLVAEMPFTDGAAAFKPLADLIHAHQTLTEVST